MLDYNRIAKVAAVQAAPVWLNLKQTVEKTVTFIEQAAQGGADLIAFPEAWLPGYPHFIWTETNSEWPAKFFPRFYENSVEIDGPELTQIRRACRQHNITAVVGISERKAGSLYISQAIINAEGELLAVRRKFKPTHAERTIFGEGDGSDFRTFDFPFGRVGALSCWEHMQPLIKYTMNSLGEQIHVASWPAVTQPYVETFGTLAFETINRMYAMENQCFVILSSHLLDTAGQELMADTDHKKTLLHLGGGTTRIYGPDGSELATPLPEDEEGLLFAELNLQQILYAKNGCDQLGHYSRPGIFSLHVDNTSPRQVQFRTENTESDEAASSKDKMRTIPPLEPLDEIAPTAIHAVDYKTA